MSKLLGGWPRGGVNDDHDGLQSRTREGTAFVRERGMRVVVVTIAGGVIELRAKGLRTPETVDLPRCYCAAMKQRVAMDRGDKAQGRGKARARRGR